MLQAAGLEVAGRTRPTGPMDVISQTLKADRVKGFYRGLLPNMLKVLPATGYLACPVYTPSIQVIYP